MGIVENDHSTVKLIELAATDEGLECVCAESAEEAIGILHANGKKFILAMVDIGLPGQDGWMLRKQIIGRWPKLKVCMMSACVESIAIMPEGELVLCLVKSSQYNAVFRRLLQLA